MRGVLRSVELLLMTVITSRPVAFFDQLATNASERGVNVIIYSGNDDMVVPHLSSESELSYFFQPALL